ncbi:hypothetical protein [Methylocapsa aurea]|uniref:hypothetical protein n=1 Tax=Methylocapsa aurea TaxID=663610 RepID=UPI003D1886DB
MTIVATFDALARLAVLPMTSDTTCASRLAGAPVTAFISATVAKRNAAASMTVHFDAVASQK